ncbi:hypothetical protein RRG08_010045 [Elysia crispata]|uniref:Uncharacterized protein n=1 Tax=Elysia crispata TaxID=231223 RepID=A0AAE1BA59_9GAST|nr:hypothetical protein RRG08_010045 [Elysia crispata]
MRIEVDHRFFPQIKFKPLSDRAKLGREPAENDFPDIRAEDNIPQPPALPIFVFRFSVAGDIIITRPAISALLQQACMSLGYRRIEI